MTDRIPDSDWFVDAPGPISPAWAIIWKSARAWKTYFEGGKDG